MGEKPISNWTALAVRIYLTVRIGLALRMELAARAGLAVGLLCTYPTA
jgi:hypothetical protein